MPFVVDENDALGKAVLAQRHRELKAGVSRAGDHHRSRTHRPRPFERAQEIPTSSPLRRFRYLTANVPGGGPKTAANLADFPGIVTCPFPDLNARNASDTRPFQMTEPALLSIDGAVATITLNRPEAFNSVNLAIAQKLEQLGAEVEANAAIKVLVIQGEGRAFSAGGDLQTIGAAAEADTIAPVVGELLKHITPSSRRCGGCRRTGSPACTARRPAPAWASPSSPISASPLKTPSSRRPMPRSASRPTAAAPSAWWVPSACAAHFRSFSPKTALPRSRRMSGDWSRKW